MEKGADSATSTFFCFTGGRAEYADVKVPGMNMTSAERLCSTCGLCCDGTFLADVELGNEPEVIGLELMGLPIDCDDQPVLPQPCAALEGQLCRIYPHRPDTCRTFKCPLLERVEQGIASVEAAAGTISQARDLAAEIRELCVQSGIAETDLPLRELYHSALDHGAQLEASWAALESMMSEYFISKVQ